MEQEIGNISIALIRKLNPAMKGIGNDFIMGQYRILYSGCQFYIQISSSSRRYYHRSAKTRKCNYKHQPA